MAADRTLTLQNVLLIHGALMILSFGVFIPLAIAVARYFKTQLKNSWLRLHIGLLLAAGISIVAGLIYASPYKTGASTLSIIDTNHSLLGWLLVLGVLAQYCLGIKCSANHELDSKQESALDSRHGLVGKIILFFGYFTCVTGVVSIKKNTIGNSQWETFSQIIGCLLFLALIGFGIMELLRGKSSRYSTKIMFAKGRKITVKDKPAIIISSFEEKDQSESPDMYRPTWKPKKGDIIDISPKETPKSRYKKEADQKPKGGQKANEFLVEVENLRYNSNNWLFSDGPSPVEGSNGLEPPIRFGEEAFCEDIGDVPIIIQKARDLKEIVPDEIYQRETGSSPKKTEVLRVRDEDTLPSTKARSLTIGCAPENNYSNSAENLKGKEAIERLYSTYKGDPSIGSKNSDEKSLKLLKSNDKLEAFSRDD